MRRAFSFIVVLLVVLAFGPDALIPAQKRRSAKPGIRTRVPIIPAPKVEIEDWKEFSSDKLKVRIMFPKKSELSEKDEIEETMYGVIPVQAANIQSYINQNFFFLSIKKYPANFLRDRNDRAEDFAAWMKVFVLRKVEIVSEKLSRYGQHSMAQFVYRSSPEEVVVHRVVVIEDTLYQLIVQLNISRNTSVELTLESNRQRLSTFFDSFQAIDDSVIDKNVGLLQLGNALTFSTVVE